MSGFTSYSVCLTFFQQLFFIVLIYDLQKVVLNFQNVEESECRRAYELAIRTYTESFDTTIPPEEVQLSDFVG